MRKDHKVVTGKSADPAGILVDSSAWIALFSARDQNHSSADELFRAAIAQAVPLMTTNLILAEVHRLILHRAGVPAAAFAIRRIDQSDRTKVVFATAAHHEAASAWLERLRDHAISYTDAASFAVMESLGCRRCLSFDSDFRRAGFLAWQDDR